MDQIYRREAGGQSAFPPRFQKYFADPLADVLSTVPGIRRCDGISKVKGQFMNKVKELVDRMKSVWPITNNQFPWSTIGVIVGLIVSVILCAWISGDQPHNNSQTWNLFEGSSAANRCQAVATAKPHLEWAARQCLADAERPLDHVRAMFADARTRTRQFSEEALGFDSKLTLISDYVQDRSDHADFLRRRFESLVLSEANLLASLEQGLQLYQQTTASVEGELLVRLRADASDLAPCPLTTTNDAFALQSLFQQALSQAQTAAGFELQATVGREVASYILGEIATHVTLQLGANVGILGAGAASGWTTLGVGIVAGLVVDQIVTATYDAYADPKGQLAAQVDARLTEMERILIDGTNDQLGLRSRLQEYAENRCALREAAVMSLLLDTNGGVQ